MVSFIWANLYCQSLYGKNSDLFSFVLIGKQLAQNTKVSKAPENASENLSNYNWLKLRQV